jgi:hypothetical protein
MILAVAIRNNHRSNGLGSYVVAGFIPASAANHAVFHRLINRRFIQDMHQVLRGDKSRRYTDSLITRTLASSVLSGNRVHISLTRHVCAQAGIQKILPDL